MVERRTIPLVRNAVDECRFANARAGESTHMRALQLACLILGGLEPLSRHLGVSSEDLLGWLQGRKEPPYEIFLAAVEILVLSVERNIPRA